MRTSRAWIPLVAVAGLLSALAIARWIWAVSLDGPVLYGEGAVAHAAMLTRYGLEYTSRATLVDGTPLASRPLFTAANYPPLYFHLAALGDPFVAGRIASILATLFVMSAIAWRARAAGRLVAFALAAGWLAAAPVIAWGAAVKPDLVALALTVAGVLVAGVSPRRILLGAALLALAVWAKPTALLPAAALGGWYLRSSGRAAMNYAATLGVVLAALTVADTFRSGTGAFGVHVLSWNQLPWSAQQTALLVVVGIATLFVPIAMAVRARPTGPIAAYVVGALGIAAIGGRDGATINYLLDLSAASALAVASAVPALRPGALYPLAATAQLVLGAVALDPFGVVPGRSPGEWSDPARIAAARSIPAGPALVEDAGLLVATGREPLVDDVFLWSRLRERERAQDLSFLEGERVIGAVEQRVFTSVVSDADLERLDDAPAFERARWHPDLVRAVLGGYRLDRTTSGLWVYLPRP